MYVVMWQRTQWDGASVAFGFVGPFGKMIEAEEYVEANKPPRWVATIVRLEQPDGRPVAAPTR